MIRKIKVWYMVWSSIIIGTFKGKTLEQILDEAIEERSRLMHENRQLNAQLEEMRGNHQ